jgi:hypothetical protein
VTTDLGIFTAAELRAGGINGRGFLQPLLPVPDGMDLRLETRAAAEGLATRGLLVRRDAGWRPIGRYQQVLEAAAVSRALLAVGPAEPGAAGFAIPRLILGCLGTTGEVLDLYPARDGYRVRLLETVTAAAELAEYLAVGDRACDDEPAVSDVDAGWGRIDALLTPGVATVRVEAASVSQAEGPLLQHRLTVVSTSEGTWMLLGVRQGDRSGRAAAPAARVRAKRVLTNLLSGESAEL